MRYLCMFSGGVSSFEAARRTIETHGRENVELWFADTLNEDRDLYRFMLDCVRFLGVPLYKFMDGRDLWGVFNSEKVIGNTRMDICSRILKRELLERERKQRFSPEECMTVIGMDWTEGDRIERTRAAHLPYRVEFPLCDPPHITKAELVNSITQLGITPPRLTRMGFPHNNCGGFCVKAGHAHFAHLLRTRPSVYAYHESEEQAWRTRFGKDHAILRDRRGSQTKPLTLREFRKRVEQGMFDETDWGGCGCFSE